MILLSSSSGFFATNSSAEEQDDLSMKYCTARTHAWVKVSWNLERGIPLCSRNPSSDSRIRHAAASTSSSAR
jgi:hypothetical protein